MIIWAKYKGFGPVLVSKKQLKFSGGEQHISIGFKNTQNISSIFIEANILSSDDLMEVVVAKNAIDNIFKGKYKPEVVAILPYLPYARSDRVCAYGEEFGLQAFGKIINTLGFSRVYTFDVHSNVAFDCVDNLVNIPQEELIKARLEDFKGKYDCVVSPDKGATEKTKLVSKILDIPVIQGFKVRDPDTGKLSGFDVYEPLVKCEKVLIVDDLIDAGGTFLGLIKVMREELGVEHVDLYVTHGIYSKGVTSLLENGINALHTFNLLYNGPHQSSCGYNQKAYDNVLQTIFDEGK